MATSLQFSQVCATLFGQQSDCCTIVTCKGVQKAATTYRDVLVNYR